MLEEAKGTNETETKDFGRFGYTPIPSDHNEPSTSSVASMTPPTDPFGLVLLLGSVQAVWHLKSLFCYRGSWHDERATELSTEPCARRREVVLTLATGISCSFLL